jgi:hypothetical protein
MRRLSVCMSGMLDHGCELCVCVCARARACVRACVSNVLVTLAQFFFPLVGLNDMGKQTMESKCDARRHEA